MKSKTEELNKKDNMMEICQRIADGLIKQFTFKTISGKREDEIWIYENGIYKPEGKTFIKARVEQTLNSLAKVSVVNEIINKVARKTYVTRESFNCNHINLICVENGVLNINTKKLIPHSPIYNFKNKIPIDFNKDAHCIKIFEFFSEILREEDINCIQEWIGYQLYREYFIKKAAIFRGIPDTGKTTFMNLLSEFIGKNNFSSVSLQLLAQGKWHVTELYNKYLNICDDLSEKDVTDSGTFKQVTGRSQIQAEFKFGDQFRFINYAKLCFACNKIPTVKTDIDDKAFWDRWMIFDFNNIFNKINNNVDNHIIDKITSKEELSGLLNWALEGLNRLIKNGCFSYIRTWEENRKIMQGEASSIAKFNDDCLIFEEGIWTSNHDLFSNYSQFCRLNNITPESDQKFHKDIKEYCKNGKFQVNKDNKSGVKHIKIREFLPIYQLE